MKKITIEHKLCFGVRFFHGELLENKKSYIVMRVTHAASIYMIASRMPYKDPAYPDGIRTFFKENFTQHENP